jgi:3-phenylpropionate/trans-cinnamate dioxygenase ferredoxin subunit
MSPPAFTPALSLADLPLGQMRCVDVNGIPVLLVHAKDGVVYAVHDICSHAFAHLHEGRLRGHRLICPLHGASFDVRSGAVLGAPATVPLASYPVRIAGDQIEVEV